jgi:hypothetical protein
MAGTKLGNDPRIGRSGGRGGLDRCRNGKKTEKRRFRLRLRVRKLPHERAVPPETVKPACIAGGWDAVNHPDRALTAANIKYLIAIEEQTLCGAAGSVRCTQIALALGVTKPSVYTMVHTLSQFGTLRWAQAAGAFNAVRPADRRAIPSGVRAAVPGTWRRAGSGRAGMRGRSLRSAGAAFPKQPRCPAGAAGAGLYGIILHHPARRCME